MFINGYQGLLMVISKLSIGNQWLLVINKLSIVVIHGYQSVIIGYWLSTSYQWLSISC